MVEVHDLLAAKDAATKLGGQAAEEIADPRFVHPFSYLAVAPLVDGTWGNEAVSPPQIPVVEREATTCRRIAETRATPTDRSRAGPRRRSPGRVLPGRDWPGRTGGGRRLVAAWRRLIASGRAGTMQAEAIFCTPDAPKPDTEKANAQDEESQVPDYLLLRYFDFDVKPNKQYQYRIFLVLDNPNYHLDANVLEDPDLAQRRFLGVHRR